MSETPALPLLPQKDRDILRETARTQLEWTHSPQNQALLREWPRHNACLPGRPLLHLEMWTFEAEVLTPLLRCETEAAREVETRLLRQYLNLSLLGDDHPVADYYPVYWRAGMVPFNIEVKRHFAQDSSGGSLGHAFETPIEDLDGDWHKLKKSRFGADRAATLAYRDWVQDILGDILPVRLDMNALYAVPTQDIVHLMGMENMMVAMLDSPRRFAEMLARYAEDTLEYYRFLEREALLLPTTGCQLLPQGSWCFTDELPAAPQTTREVWGFMDSQESVSISPQMFAELVFPCYQTIAAQYGLLSYGCCEPVDKVWGPCLSTLPNLRKVSISPWCDEAYMGEQLRGRKIVYLRKPSPNFLGLGGPLDEDALRAHIQKTLGCAAGCTLEIAQRDVYTVGGNVHNARRYVQVLREEIENHWKG